MYQLAYLTPHHSGQIEFKVSSELNSVLYFYLFQKETMIVLLEKLLYGNYYLDTVSAFKSFLNLYCLDEQQLLYMYIT